MAQPYIGQITLFAGNFAPYSYAFCDGRTINISDNDALYALIGTTYGGDGVNTFALPDLRGRVPIHQGTASTGTSYVEGQKAGVEQVTLTTQQIPAHNHGVVANSAAGNQANPSGGVLAGSTTVETYEAVTPSAQDALSSQAVAASGSSQPHDNHQPFLAVSYIIALYGVFPSRN